MKFLPQNKLYRAEVLVTLLAAVVYSIAYYLSGNVDFAASCVVSASVGFIVVAFAVVPGVTFAIAASVAAFTAFVAVSVIVGAFDAAVFSTVIVIVIGTITAYECKFRLLKVVVSLLSESGILWLWFYIINHPQMHLVVP